MYTLYKISNLLRVHKKNYYSFLQKFPRLWSGAGLIVLSAHESDLLSGLIITHMYTLRIH